MTRVVRLASPEAGKEIQFHFHGPSCVLMNVATGRRQTFGDIAAQFLIDELKGYGWKEIP